MLAIVQENCKNSTPGHFTETPNFVEYQEFSSKSCF